MSTSKYEFDDFELQVLANSVKDLLAKACNLEELDSYLITVGTPKEIGRSMDDVVKKENLSTKKSYFVVTQMPVE